MLTFHPEAVAEMRDAAQWYEERTEGLGLRFLDAVESAATRITERPQLGAVWVSSRLSSTNVVQRFPLTTFPYLLVYTTSADGVLVIAVAHGRRRPGYWAARRRQ